MLEIQRGQDMLESLFALIGARAVVAGSFALWAVEDSPQWSPSDIDLFPADDIAFQEILMILDGLGYYITFESDNAISHSIKQWHPHLLPYAVGTIDIPADSIHLAQCNVGETGYPLRCDLKIQVIKPHLAGDSEKLLKRFDWSICQVLIAYQGGLQVQYEEAFEQDLRNRDLRLADAHSPIQSLSRAMKYTKRDFYLPASEILTLLDAWLGLVPEERVKMRNEVKNIADETEWLEGEWGLAPDDDETDSPDEDGYDWDENDSDLDDYESDEDEDEDWEDESEDE